MKPRNREINIFNLSMLDVICGALGAFLILFLIAAPHYGNTGTQSDGNSLAHQLTVLTTWDAADADVDMWIFTPKKEWVGPKGGKLLGRIQPDYSFPNVDGSERSGFSHVERYRDHAQQLGPGAYVVVTQLRKTPPGMASVEVQVTPMLDIHEPPAQNIAPMRSFTLKPGEVQVTGIVQLSPQGRSLVYRMGVPWRDPGTWPAEVSANLQRGSGTR